MPVTGQWISLIKCCLPHICLMNKDTSLLSDTPTTPLFPLVLFTKDSVKPASQINHSPSVTYTMLIKENNSYSKAGMKYESEVEYVVDECK